MLARIVFHCGAEGCICVSFKGYSGLRRQIMNCTSVPQLDSLPDLIRDEVQSGLRIRPRVLDMTGTRFCDLVNKNEFRTRQSRVLVLCRTILTSTMSPVTDVNRIDNKLDENELGNELGNELRNELGNRADGKYDNDGTEVEDRLSEYRLGTDLGSQWTIGLVALVICAIVACGLFVSVYFMVSNFL